MFETLKKIALGAGAEVGLEFQNSALHLSMLLGRVLSQSDET